MSRPVIGSAYVPRRYSLRTPMTYSALRPEMDGDAEHLQRALLVDAHRRARTMRTAATDDLRRAKARRICFDLLRALKGLR